MITQIFDIYDPISDKDKIAAVAQILKNGGLVTIPTETVYGLAADALNEDAVKNIFKAKGRPQDNPLIVHISELDMIFSLVSEFPEKANRLAQKFWPGPLTMILKKADIVPDAVSGGLDTVAVRFPSNEIAREIIRQAKTPLAAPSANLSGSPSPTTAKHVYDDMFGRVDAMVRSSDCEVGVESTVILMTTETPSILRPGKITPDDIRAVIGEVSVDKAVLEHIDSGAKVSSPGMKYKHYSPKSDVKIVEGTSSEYCSYVNQFKKNDDVFALCFDEDIENLSVKYVSYGSEKSSVEQAHKLFTDLRNLDELGAKTVFAHSPSKNGVGLAVYNRLIRAAAFEVIKL